MVVGFVPQGSEFQVHAPSSHAQDEGRVIALAGGGFVVTWVSQHQDGSYDGVFAQVYDAQYAPSGGVVQINTRFENNQNNQSITALHGGGFVVTWFSQYDESYAGQGVYSQRFDASGAKRGGEVFHNYPNEGMPRVGATSDGGYVLIYADLQLVGINVVQVLSGQKFDVNGVQVGSGFTINTHNSDTQNQPEMVSLNDGSFVVVWTSYGQDGSGAGIYGQRFDADSTPLGAEFPVNATLAGDQSAASVAALAQGFVVVWTSGDGQDGAGAGVFSQRFDATGAKTGAEVQVNTSISGDQKAASVAALQDGGFVMVWEGAGGLGVTSVFGQRFDASGATLGTEFVIATSAGDYYAEASVAALTDGGFVVTWTSWETGAPDVVSQVFLARTFGTSSGEVLTDTDGINWINGLAGDDTLTGLGGDDTLFGGAANDMVLGGAGSDVLYGGAGNDVLKGGVLGDALYGGAGRDRLKGGGGHDVLTGGVGKDTLFGQAGRDRFVFNTASDSKNTTRADTIADFEVGRDQIDLSALAGLTFIGTAAFSGNLEVRFKVRAEETLVRADIDGDGVADMKIVLTDVGPLSGDDFIL